MSDTLNPINGTSAVPYSLPIGKEFQRFVGPSRTTQYEVDKAREIETFLVGNRRYVIVQSWIDYVARQRAKEEARRAAGIRPLMRGEGAVTPRERPPPKRRGARGRAADLNIITTKPSDAGETKASHHSRIVQWLDPPGRDER
jgi:hypothetical protein